MDRKSITSGMMVRFMNTIHHCLTVLLLQAAAIALRVLVLLRLLRSHLPSENGHLVPISLLVFQGLSLRLITLRLSHPRLHQLLFRQMYILTQEIFVFRWVLVRRAPQVVLLRSLYPRHLLFNIQVRTQTLFQPRTFRYRLILLFLLCLSTQLYLLCKLQHIPRH